MNKKYTGTKIKLVTIDIDGCITIRKGRNIPLESISLIQRSQPKVPIVLCTGRSQPYTEAILQMLGLENSDHSSIVENGCFLYNPKKDLLFPHPDLKKDSFDEIRKQLEQVLPQTVRREPGKEVCISLNPPHEIPIVELYAIVVNLLDGKDVSVTHGNSAVDIVPKNIDKAAGLLFLTKKENIDPDEILSIGDSKNDIPTLLASGFAACSENASAEVKELVRRKKENGFIANYQYARGVVEILQHYNVI